MTHASIAELRRLVDDPKAVRQAARHHVDSCETCRSRVRRFSADATAVDRALPDLPPGDLGVDLAWARLRRRLEDRRPPVPAPRRRRAVHRISRRGAAAVAGAVVLLAATSAAATEIVTVLRPTKVAPVELASGDLSSILEALPGATLTQTDGGQTQTVASVAEAEADTGLRIVLPTRLPSGVGGTPTLNVQPAMSYELSFGAGGTSGAGRAVGHGPVPSWLVGTTLRLQAGPAVIATYSGGAGSGIPALVVGYAPAPVLTATGASPSQIEDYVLAQPGISPALAAEIRVLGAPGTVIPVPVPSTASVSDVTVDGAPAVALSDPSGFAAGVIWESGRTVTAVGGLITRDQALAVADELG